MITIVRSLQTIVLHHTIVKGSLGVPAVAKLHVGASPLQTGGVGHELRGTHGLHLPEELHGAAGNILAFSKTLSDMKRRLCTLNVVTKDKDHTWDLESLPCTT